MVDLQGNGTGMAFDAIGILKVPLPPRKLLETGRLVPAYAVYRFHLCQYPITTLPTKNKNVPQNTIVPHESQIEETSNMTHAPGPTKWFEVQSVSSATAISFYRIDLKSQTTAIFFYER
jgi:hypothetical protein